MTTVTVFALTIPPSPMFERRFARPRDAQDYALFFKNLGACHVRTKKD